MSEPAPAVHPLGEGAWTATLGQRVDRALHQRVLALAARIEAANLPGIREIVPAYAALTVFFDPLTADAEAIRGLLAHPERTPGHPDTERSLGHPDRERSEREGSRRRDPSGSLNPRDDEQVRDDAGRLSVIPVRYDGPDLDQVAARTGMTRADVIRLHTSREYLVYLLGFAPGFAYLGDLDPALVLPRRPEPRTRVPAGSVAIAGAQTAVYPLATPGGWHLLGTTALRLFDPARRPPALLQPGDRVRFRALP